MLCDLISEIVKYPNGSTMYLSGLDVYKTSKIRELNIRTIISITREPIEKLENDIRQFSFMLDDAPDVNIYSIFEPTYRIIMSAIQQNENILVHCRAGISRSVTVLIAFFLKCLRCNPELVLPYIPRTKETWTESILTFIRSKRNCTNPNTGFKKQLEIFEKMMLPRLNCDPKPYDYLN